MTIETRKAQALRNELSAVATLHLKSKMINGRVYWYGENTLSAYEVKKGLGSDWKRISKSAAATILAENVTTCEVTLEQFRAYEKGELTVIEITSTPELDASEYAVTPEAQEIAVNAEIKSVAIDKNSAEMILNLNGDSTLIGQFISDLDLTLGFIKDDNGNWHLKEIENLDVLTPILVDKAEIIKLNFLDEK